MHLMLDLETASTSPLSAILQIGAVLFNPYVPDQLGEEFEAHIDLESCIKAGMKIDGDTIRWWMQQSKEAQEQVWQQTHREVPIVVALSQFELFIKKYRPDGYWSHGASFDIPMMECAFRRCLGREVPIHFSKVRDTRTLLFLTGDKKAGDFKPRHEGVHHNALDDAKYQACWTQRAIRELTNK